MTGAQETFLGADEKPLNPIDIISLDTGEVSSEQTKLWEDHFIKVCHDVESSKTDDVYLESESGPENGKIFKNVNEFALVEMQKTVDASEDPAKVVEALKIVADPKLYQNPDAKEVAQLYLSTLEYITAIE